MSNHLVLGIDPGLVTTGYGVIDSTTTRLSLVEAGVIHTSAKLNIEKRMSKIFDGVSQIIHQYQPSILVLEELYSHYQHPKTAILMGHARGVICYAAAVSHTKVIGYSATRVKKTITGNGSASKLQLQRMIKKILNLKNLPCPQDVADALALAVCHVMMSQKTRLNKYNKSVRL